MVREEFQIFWRKDVLEKQKACTFGLPHLKHTRDDRKSRFPECNDKLFS